MPSLIKMKKLKIILKRLYYRLLRNKVKIRRQAINNKHNKYRTIYFSLARRRVHLQNNTLYVIREKSFCRLL